MNVQFWQVSGYEANADIEDEPSADGGLHRGLNTHDGAVVWVFWDPLLRRWQEIDPSLSGSDYPSDDAAARERGGPTPGGTEADRRSQ